MDWEGEAKATATAAPPSLPPQGEAPDPLIGAVLAGRYTIGSVLGRGGMGAVYRATSEQWGECAVKTMRADGSLTSKDAVRRFLREARASLAIKSEHVVRVFEIDVDADERPFLAMQLLSGRDLSQQIQDHGPLDPAVAAALLVQACQGLEAAHRLGIIHRDIKPANLFLHEEEGGQMRLKVCDFGIAKQLSDPQRGDASTDLTRTGGLVGSPAYMSPEQAQNAKTTDHRTDVWSLAVTFHEALCGLRLWSDTQNLGALLVTLCTRDAPPLRERAPWVPEGLAAAIHRGLQRDPALRHASVADFAKAVAPFAASLPLSRASLAPIEQREQVRLSSVSAMTAAPEGGATLAASAARSPDASAAVAFGSSSALASLPKTKPTGRRFALPVGIAVGLVLAGGLALRIGISPALPVAAAVGSTAPAALASAAGAGSGVSVGGVAGAGSGAGVVGAGSVVGVASAAPEPSSVASAPAAAGVAAAGSAAAVGPGKKKTPAANSAAPEAPKAVEPAPAAPAAKKPATKDEWQ